MPVLLIKVTAVELTSQGNSSNKKINSFIKKFSCSDQNCFVAACFPLSQLCQYSQTLPKLLTKELKRSSTTQVPVNTKFRKSNSKVLHLCFLHCEFQARHFSDFCHTLAIKFSSPKFSSKPDFIDYTYTQ